MQDEIVTTIGQEDFVAAYRPAARPRRVRNLTLALAFLIALLITLLLLRFPEARTAFIRSPVIIGLAGAVILAASLVAGLLVAAPTLRRRAARSAIEDHPGMRDPVHYRFDPEHFAVQTTYTQASYPWAELWDWRECERTVIILPTPRNFYVLPKRAIDPSALERLRGYLSGVRKRR